MSSSIVFFKSVLSNYFCESAKYRGLKIEYDFVPHEMPAGRPNVMVSVTILCTGVTDPNEFQRLLHGINRKHGSAYDLIAINVVLIQNESLLLSCPYDIYSTSVGKASETLAAVFPYRSFVWESQAMKAIDNKRNECTSKNNSEQDFQEPERQGRDDMEIVEVRVTDEADSMFVESGPVVNF